MEGRAGRRGGRGELTEPGPPRPGEVGAAAVAAAGSLEVRLPRLVPARAASWAGAPQTPAEQSAAAGQAWRRGRDPGALWRVCERTALRAKPLPGAAAREPGGALFPESRSRGARRFLAASNPGARGALPCYP